MLCGPITRLHQKVNGGEPAIEFNAVQIKVETMGFRSRAVANEKFLVHIARYIFGVQREVRREIGMLFQGSALFDSKNVEDNIKFPLDILTNINENEKIEKVNHCLELVGLEKINKKMPSELSGGMKKRVGIARAIVNDSKYLFCDEPNSGLDPLTAIKIDDLILELTKKLNTTTIVVTHDMNSVIEIGEYIMFLHNGKKIWEGNNKNILKTKVKELNEFVFSNKLMKKLR